MRRPGLAGGQRIGGGQAHVVVGVHFDFQAGVAAQRADLVEGAERFEDTQRVGKAQAAGARPFGGFGQGAEEVEVGARGILAAEADFQPEAERGTDEFGQFAQQPGAILF
jgi:hypothetical protein